MTKFCRKHPKTELVVVTYCPVCRASAGGKKAAAGMTAAQRTARARKAALARRKKKGRGK